MSIQEIAINTQTLQNDINSMQEALEKVKRRTENMFNEIKALNNMWSGMAHTAFEQQFGVDYQRMMELYKTINGLISCMQYANREYTTCENNIHSVINSIRI